MLTTDTIAGDDRFASLKDDWESAEHYLSIFIDEAEHTIDELIEALLALEAGGGRENVERLFVAAHRMKGSAASIGLNRVAKLSHRMEDVLQALVDSGRSLTPAIADAMLSCTDGLQRYVEMLKSGRPAQDRFDALARQLTAAQTAFDSHETKEKAETTAESASPEPFPVHQSTPAPSISDLRRRVAPLVREGEQDTTVVGCAIFEPALPQVGLKARLLYEKLSNLGEVRYFDPPADDVDMREQLDAVSFGVATELSPDAVQNLLRIAGVQRLTMEPLRVDASPTEDPAPARAKASESSFKPAETIRVDIKRLDQLMNLAGELAISKARVAQIAEVLKRAVAGGPSARVLNGVAAELEKMANGAASSGNAALRSDVQHLRHAARRLHKELESVRREVESLALVRACVIDLFETVHSLDRVSDGIHQAVMNTRMLPIGPLFARFHRVIRDMTRTSGKDIRLVISGETTELDKRMIDELADPMIHMIRNAADHGIESPEARVAAGKPAQGTVSLHAFHRASNIVIRVSDDGRGLDHDRIRSKAIEKGLISAADAERLGRQQVYQLIWQPGLSTAEKLTEVSGRGVGMDILRSKIDQLSGVIAIDSEPGQGTTLTIKLPLTLAILPSLTVAIDGDIFAIPLESVVEIVQVRRRDMNTVCGRLTAAVRDRVVSVVQLGALFGWSRAAGDGDSDSVLLLIIGEGDRRLGLIVDHVVGEEDVVIKSIADNYRNLAGIAGASILGDGRVSLILDPLALIEMSSHPIVATADT